MVRVVSSSWLIPFVEDDHNCEILDPAVYRWALQGIAVLT